MLIYQRNTFPIGIIKDNKKDYCIIIDDKETITTLANHIYRTLKEYRTTKLNIELMKDYLYFLDENELLMKIMLTYIHNYQFKIGENYTFNMIRLFDKIDSLNGTKIILDGEEYEINEMQILFSPVLYIVDILNWHIEKDLFIPITKWYKGNVKLVNQNTLKLEPNRKNYARRLSLLKGKLIDFILKYLTIKKEQYIPAVLLPNQIDEYIKKKKMLEQGTTWFVYTIDFNNKPFTVLISNIKEGNFKNITSFSEWFIEKQDLIDPVIANKILIHIKLRNKVRMKEVLKTTNKDVVRDFIRQMINEGEYLPFYKDVDYEVEENDTVKKIKLGEYKPQEITSHFFEDEPSLADKFLNT